MAKPADRAYAILAVAAREMNSEMTIMMGAAERAMEFAGDDDPGRVELKEIIAATTRCALLAAEMLAFAMRNNIRPTAATLKSLTDA